LEPGHAETTHRIQDFTEDATKMKAAIIREFGDFDALKYEEVPNLYPSIRIIRGRK